MSLALENMILFHFTFWSFSSSSNITEVVTIYLLKVITKGMIYKSPFSLKSTQYVFGAVKLQEYLIFNFYSSSSKVFTIGNLFVKLNKIVLDLSYTYYIENILLSSAAMFYYQPPCFMLKFIFTLLVNSY